MAGQTEARRAGKTGQRNGRTTRGARVSLAPSILCSRSINFAIDVMNGGLAST